MEIASTLLLAVQVEQTPPHAVTYYLTDSEQARTKSGWKVSRFKLEC